MNGIKFEFQDLDLDEGGIQTEFVITHHEGSASFILTDEEIEDLLVGVRQRWNINRAYGRAQSPPQDPIARALGVIARNPNIRAWLAANDLQALKQVDRAMLGVPLPFERPERQE